MSGAPDLFVVCKNCRAEVSPYITECPYCGHRLRKRAPKLDKGAVPRRPKASRRRPSAPSLGRLRPGEMPGVRDGGAGKPVVTIGLVLAAVIFTVLVRSGVVHAVSLVMIVGPQGDWWRPVSTTFFYGSTAYEVTALGAIFLFGWLLERRHGHWAPLLVFAIGTAAGMAVALVSEPTAYITGANGGALALLCAWVVRDLLAARRGEEIEADLLGVAVIAILLALLPAANLDAHPLVGAGGAVAGLLLGFPLARLSPR